MTAGILSVAGGARAGWINTPFAGLVVSQSKLDLNVPLLRRYSFASDQVIAIKKYAIVPFFEWGIQILHNVPTYPQNLIFWCFGNPESLIRKIEETGFLPRANPVRGYPQLGLPIRWRALAVAVVFSNVCVTDILRPTSPSAIKPGPCSFIAIFLLFLGLIGIWRVRWLQQFFLKPERSPSEIKFLLYPLTLFSGCMSAILAILMIVNRI